MSKLRLAPVALGAMFALSSPLRAPMAKGFTYDIVQHSTTMNPMNGGTQNVVAVRAHVQTDAAGRSRMDITDAAANPIWSAGDYALMSSGTMMIVSPAKKEILDLGPDMGMSESQTFMKSMGMDMKMSDGTITFDSLPGTELVNGHQAKHFKMTRDGTMSMTTPMGAMDMAVKSETNYYVTRDRAPQNSALVSPNVSSGPAAMMSPESMAKMRTMIGSMKGFVIRAVTHSSTTVMGMNTEATQTTDIENLKEEEVAPVPTTAPEGYTKANLGDRMRAMAPRPPG
jgi:hypothetical protein